MSGRARSLLGPVTWLSIGAWLGALVLCGAVVIRAAFATAPDPRIAAHFVGRVLGPLQLAGIGLGVGLAALGGVQRRGALAVGLPLALAACCAVNHFAISPAVAAIDLADPAAGPGAGLRFARLHQLSVALFVATGVGVLALAAVHLVRQLGEERPGRP